MGQFPDLPWIGSTLGKGNSQETHVYSIFFPTLRDDLQVTSISHEKDKEFFPGKKSERIPANFVWVMTLCINMYLPYSENKK